MTPLWSSNGWRLCFLAGGLAILIGGPLHPGGTMAEMLAHPDWLRAHVLVLAGFVGLSAGLVLCGRALSLPPRIAWWRRAAVAGAVLQSIDFVFHTAAMVDHDRLVAGAATPILTTHLAMTAVIYPVFAVLLIGFVIAAARERLFGAWWTAWLAIAGAVGHGLAGPLVVVWSVPWARSLFPMVVLIAAWMVVAAGWPARALRTTAVRAQAG